jgi:hypothetical protein
MRAFGRSGSTALSKAVTSRKKTLPGYIGFDLPLLLKRFRNNSLPNSALCGKNY